MQGGRVLPSKSFAAASLVSVRGVWVSGSVWSGVDIWFCSYRETLFKMMWSGRDFWFCLYRETGFKVMWTDGFFGFVCIGRHFLR